MTPPTFEIVALYSGVSRTMSSALSARASSSAAASDVDCGGFTGGTVAAVGVVGGAGGVAEDCSIGLGSGALRGAYSAVKAYITAIDKTKARMTRFSIQDYLRIPISQDRIPRDAGGDIGAIARWRV